MYLNIFLLQKNESHLLNIILETKSFLSNWLIIFPSCKISIYIVIFHTENSMRISRGVFSFLYSKNAFGLNFSMKPLKNLLACQAHLKLSD